MRSLCVWGTKAKEAVGAWVQQRDPALLRATPASRAAAAGGLLPPAPPGLGTALKAWRAARRALPWDLKS